MIHSCRLPKIHTPLGHSQRHDDGHLMHSLSCSDPTLLTLTALLAWRKGGIEEINCLFIKIDLALQALELGISGWPSGKRLSTQSLSLCAQSFQVPLTLSHLRAFQIMLFPPSSVEQCYVSCHSLKLEVICRPL